jgi:hypothetical protein
MNRSKRLLFLAVISGLCNTVAAQSSPPAESRRWALLVGCTRYPSLSNDRWLRGPANDVRLMRSLLIHEFGFPDDAGAIVTLAEGDDTDRPIRDNIKRGLEHLAEIAASGDQVVVFLSGHGSQQPDQAPVDEDDGFDETFLPADIGRWDGSKMTVENAIVDDELSVWLDAICRKGARVWLIADSCSSGTLIRGLGHSIPRWVPPSELIPKEILEKEAETATKLSAGSVEDLSRLQGLVSLCAAPPGESTFEDPLPGPGGPYSGRLTYTLVQVLKEPHPPLTYWELARRIRLRYDARQWDQPTPMLEGRDGERERLVLGEKDAHPCRFELVRGDRGQLQLKAGALHGLTAGTILAVKGTGPDDVPGHVRILPNGLGSLESEVGSCTPDGTAAPDDLTVPAFCRVAFLDYSDLRVRVAVDRDFGAVESPQARGLEKLAARELAQLDSSLHEAASLKSQGESIMTPVGDPAGADWLIRATSSAANRVGLVHATGSSRGHRPKDALGPFDASPSEIEKRVLQIARVRNLLKVTSVPNELLGQAEPESQLEVEVRRMKDREDEEGEAVRFDSDLTFHVGEIAGFAVKNAGKTPLDVTMLWIDGNYGISPVFPHPKLAGLDNRIQPGDRLLRRVRINELGLGREHLVVIAVAPREHEERADFGFLANRTFAEAVRGLRERGGAGGASRSLDSPLGQLMQRALFARGETRGLGTVDARDYSARVLSITSRPKVRDAHDN